MLVSQHQFAGLWASRTPGSEDEAQRSLRYARAVSGRLRQEERAAVEDTRTAQAILPVGGRAGLTEPHETVDGARTAQAAPGGAVVAEPYELALTADAVRAAARDGVIVATFANLNHLDFVLNWVAHLRAAGLHNHFVGCTDDALRDELVRRRVRCARVESAMPVEEAKWGSSGFAAMGRTKGALLLRLLELDAAAVLFLDLDAVVLRDPLPYLLRAVQATGAELLMHSDSLVASTAVLDVDDAAPLEDLRRSIGPELNTGLFLIRPTNATRQAAREWVRVMADDKFFGNWKNDQQAFNQVLRQGLHYPPAGAQVAEAFGGLIKLGVLPVHLFASGHTFSVQRLHHKLQVRPFAVHVTFVNCDSPGKRSRLREAGEWLGPPDGIEHLDSAGLTLAEAAGTGAAGGEGAERFLWYDVDMPASLTADFAPVRGRVLRADSDPVVARHWQLMNHQLLQLRRALALAVASNRTLLLPRLLCGLETTTNFAHSGVRCPECGMELPYLCPTDHVLRMHYWAGKPPSGPKPALQIRTREYSFLEGPHRSLLAARASGAHVAIELRRPGEQSAARARPCELTQCASPTRALLERTPAAATATLDVPVDGVLLDTAVREQLRAHEAAPLWRVTDLTAADVRFADAQLAKQFAETMMWLPGGWCCTTPPIRGKPGHFFYDIWWDTLPHTDRWGRRFEQKWEALPGP